MGAILSRRTTATRTAAHPQSAEIKRDIRRSSFGTLRAPRYLLRDRDGIYGQEFTGRVDHMGIKEVKTAARSPWHNPYVERMSGTLRRDCLEHVIVLNDNHLRRILRDYLTYYHRYRTHLSLDKDSPEPRSVEPPDQGRIAEFPMVGGLHHRYSRLAA